MPDCWSTIGVSGNGTCRELERYVHCRNCPVYSAAALQLLDRPVTNEYRREWTAHFAREKKFSAPARTSLVVFRIGGEWLALPTPAFQEVAERRAAHSLPHRRRGVVLGLVNVRGELLICVSLARWLGLGGVRNSAFRIPHSALVFDRLLVASWEGSRFAFPVDEVHGLHRLAPGELREPPATIARSAVTHTRGIFSWHAAPRSEEGGREHTVGLLDAGVLFAGLNGNLS